MADKTMKPIIDISQHNGIIRFPDVADQVYCAVIRCGYRGYGSGKIAEDKRAAINIEGCQENKIPFCLYYFPTDITKAESLSSSIWLDKFCRAHDLGPKRAGGNVGIWLDSEMSNNQHDGRSDHLHKDERTDLLLDLYLNLTELGYQSGIYCSDSWFFDRIDGKTLREKHNIPFWIARYSDKKPRAPYDVWQYTSRGQIRGINGNVDLSVSNGYIISH